MAAFFVVGVACMFWILREGNTAGPDPVACNDIVNSVGEQWGSLKTQDLPGKQYHLDYVVLDLDGSVLAATRSGLETDIPAAVRRRDIILDVRTRDKIVGNIIIQNAAPREEQTQRRALETAGLFLLLAPLAFCAGFSIYLRRKLICPFRKLETFARRVAAGNLEVPLEMDRQNLFGPFTESFDLMRTELLRAKESEYRADRSKKELVASLSHDIKTPVASIQAITELMLVQEQKAAARKNLKTIYAKAKQIAQLVNNLFHASLNELEKLRVSPAEESSAVLTGLLRAADYKGQAIIPDVPPCMLCVDRLRLAQVFDNIFSNSYKYADTAIHVEFLFAVDSLVAAVSDSGPGAPEQSLPLLCNKFYRGENAAEKSGSGLGLYLARYFMEQMGGSLSCENKTDGKTSRGFTVYVGMPLAGR
jgi:signal transduction histidine kinase